MFSNINELNKKFLPQIKLELFKHMEIKQQTSK